jgi:Ca2+-binding EF-hand superfamily protein
MTPQDESAILEEVRRAYQRPSPEAEERLFRTIEMAQRLPPGEVAPTIQATQAKRIFLKFDLDGDGALRAEELPESMRAERGRWDTNRDGFINADEYWAYYQGRLGFLSEQVSSGQIDLGLKRGGPTAISGSPRPMSVPAKPPSAANPADNANRGGNASRAGNSPSRLPDWFLKLDSDRDGQIGLYEWKDKWTESKLPFAEFFSMDRNDDGFITVDELWRYLALQSADRSNNQDRMGTTTVSTQKKP